MGLSSSEWRSRLATWAPLSFWIAVIFYFSSSQGSLDQTSRVFGPLLAYLMPGSSPETRAFYHFLIRKTAHVTLYAILAGFAWRALCRVSPSAALVRRSAATLGVVLAIALADELNQSFNRARTGSFYDVLLDLSGGLAATAALCVIAKSRLSRSPANS